MSLAKSLCRGLILFLALNSFAGIARAQVSPDSLKRAVSDLKKNLTALEEQLAELTKTDSSATPSDAAMEAELARELGAELPAQQPKPAPPVSPVTQKARSRLFQNMNPNVSVIGTLLGSANTLNTTDRNVDLAFDEGEFAFQAAVDPYAKADFYIAFARPGEADLLPKAAESDSGAAQAGLSPFEAEIEEAYLTVLSLPYALQLKAGKFRSRFGKINETHPHAYNFIDVPLMYNNYFGPEGLNDEGVSLSWLLPNEAFFQELTVQVTAGPGENASFARAENNKLLYLAHLKNFFDLSDNTTLELGVTGLTGAHNEQGDNTRMLAADLTLKWKPLQHNRTRSFELLSEFLVSKKTRGAAVGGDVTSIGFYIHARYQVAKRWFLGGLVDYAEFPDFSDFNRKAYSGIVQFFASEFQKVDFQYKYHDGNFFENFSEFKLRAVFVIGAHGAHQY